MGFCARWRVIAKFGGGESLAVVSLMQSSAIDFHLLN